MVPGVVPEAAAAPPAVAPGAAPAAPEAVPGAVPGAPAGACTTARTVCPRVNRSRSAPWPVPAPGAAPGVPSGRPCAPPAVARGAAAGCAAPGCVAPGCADGGAARWAAAVGASLCINRTWSRVPLLRICSVTSLSTGRFALVATESVPSSVRTSRWPRPSWPATTPCRVVPTDSCATSGGGFATVPSTPDRPALEARWPPNNEVARTRSFMASPPSAAPGPRRRWRLPCWDSARAGAPGCGSPA